MADHVLRRGELRIYLGAAPGVGKTYAMLHEARRRADRGADVVVAFVETHGRALTARAAAGLEVVPRRRVTHGGREFAEMDVDAVLARRPAVAVVDELAHTNVPGSRNAKRWQDVHELLGAGIDVLSTVNVQHLESLDDVVERITGVSQRETVPDTVVRAAEQVELVDITPEALRRRLAHGNVYAADRVDAALRNYFRPGNLTALRELALLWVADQVDVALLKYRAEHDIADTWEARERVVVAVTGGPESETLLRRAARIATRAGGAAGRAEVLCVHVLRGDGLAGSSPIVLTELRRLADGVGASFHTVVGDDVPVALLEFARGVNATQLVIGTSRRSRIARVFDEGIGAATVQASGAIDVHMVTHDEEGRALRTPGLATLRGVAPRGRRLTGWALALALPGAVATVGSLGDGWVTSSTHVTQFFLATIVVAIVGGLGPALLAAVVSGVVLNFFFTEPRFSLVVSSAGDIVSVIAMIVVAVMVALVVDRAARRAEQAARAGAEAALLASFARTVLASRDPLPRLLERVREAFGQDSVALLERRDGGWQPAAVAGTTPCANPRDADADVAISDGGIATGSDGLDGSAVHLALRGRPLAAHDRRLLETVAGHAVLALRQQRATLEAAHAKRRASETELRTALLSAVGHDLRTPLTSIKAAIGALRDPELRLSGNDTTELLATIEESADRLRALIDNLLDSSRLAAGAVTPARRAVGCDEIVARALSTVDGAIRVLVHVDEQLPRVLADPGLAERVIANLVDNALRHARGADVAVHASAHAGRVELRVTDHGPGVPPGADVFTPFSRAGATGPGLGLGLSVARGFTEAMGGTITAEDTPGGGLTVVVSLPEASAPGSGTAPGAEPSEDAVASRSESRS